MIRVYNKLTKRYEMPPPKDISQQALLNRIAKLEHQLKLLLQK